MRKNRIEINLLNPETKKEIKIEAPKTIVMGKFQALLELKYGLPSFDVKPIDIIGTVIDIGLVLLIVLLGFLAGEVQDSDSSTIILILIALGFVFLSVLYVRTRFYFKNYIQKKLTEGYIVTDENLYDLLRETGTTISPNFTKDKGNEK